MIDYELKPLDCRRETTNPLLHASSCAKGITFTFYFQYTRCLLFIIQPEVLLGTLYLWFFQNPLPYLGSFFQVELRNSHLVHLSIKICQTPMHILQLEMSNSNMKFFQRRSPTPPQRSSIMSSLFPMHNSFTGCLALVHNSFIGCLTLGHKPLLIV